MAIYEVVHHKENDDIEVYQIEAIDMADARARVLVGENISIREKVVLDNNIYWQRNPIYKGIKLGDSNLDFQNNGCFTCALAYLVKKSPLEVMDILKKAGAYAGALIISSVASKALGLKLEKGDDKFITGKMNDINFMPKYNCVKEVYLGKSQHFVVRLVDKKGGRKIFDPWTGKMLAINEYPFISYRLFHN